MSKLLKKTIAVTTSVTTILSLSGVALFAPAFVFAATIVDGDTITTADSFDIYIVKHIGDKKFKRLILNPEVFESYGHLTWDGVKTVTQAEQDEYTTSELVRAVDDKKVYKLTSEPNSDTGVKSWVNMTAAEFVTEGYDWDSIYEINTTDRDNYTAGTDTVPAGTVVPVTGGVSVALASDTPVSASVAMGSQNVVFAKLNFTADENATISALSVRRAGVANDADFSDIKLWDGSTQLGATQALNTTTHKAVFTGLSWAVPSGMTKVLTITGSIAGTGTAATGTSPRLGIAAAADITATGDVSGTFPVYGKSMTIAGLAVGTLNVDVRTVPGNNSPVSGSTDQEISSWTFAAANEGMSVSNIKLTQVGTASNADLANIKLKINGAQVGSTVASLASDGTATFDLSSSQIAIDSGTSKIIYVHADIAAGITTERTANFEITSATDVTAFGANSGGSVTVTYSSGTTFVAQTGTNAQTISQGTALTITTNGSTNPTAQTFVRGATQELITAFRFSAGAGEDQRVARIKLQLGGSGADATDISNVTLYKYDVDTGTETQVGTPTAFVGTIATYGADSIGLDTGVFDVAESTNVVIHVRADVSAAASWTALGIFINEVRLDGIKSQGNIGAATDSTCDAIGEVTNHSAHATVGTITMSASPSNPAAQNVVPGTTGFVFGKFDFTMANESAILSSVTVDLCDGAACTDESGNTTSPAEASDITNVKLWNGSTQLGTTASTPATSQAFSFNLTLPKNETVTLTVTGDIPTDAQSSAWTSSIAAVGIDRDITATGISSAATVTDPTADALGSAMTAVVETVTVLFQNVPSSTVIVNQSQAVISKAVLTAGSVGDVRVSSIQFTADNATALNGASSANTEFGSLKIFDVTGGLNTQLGSMASAFDDAAGGDNYTFTGLSLLISKGMSKVIELRGNVLAAGDGNVFVGFTDISGSSSDVVATGLSSNTTIYGSGTDADDSGEITISSAGTLAVAVDAATPLAQYVAVGSTAGKTGVDFAKFKFTASNEAIEIEALQVTLAQDNSSTTDNNEIPNFSAIHLYNGATKVGSTAYPAGSNDSATTTFAFYFDTANDEIIVPKDDNIVLTVKADLNGTSNGANSTTTPNFYLADVAGSSTLAANDVDARGVSSGSRVTVSAGTPDPQAVTVNEPDNVNAMTIVRGKPTFALCTASNCSKASPSGALVPGITEVIRFRITAEAYDVDFDGTNHNIRFTIAQGGGASTARDAVMYEYGKTTALQSILNGDLTSVGTLNFNAIDTTISAGTYKEYYVTVELTDYATTGDTFRLSVENAAADLSWSDGLTTDISIASITDGLPMTGGTLTK